MAFHGRSCVSPLCRLNAVVFALAMAVLLAACKQADPLESNGLEPNLASIQANIFTPSCAVSGCHAGANPQMGMNLSAGQARQNLVSVASVQVPGLRRVEPGNADDSYLIIKLEGSGRMATGTQRMPQGRPALAPQEIGIVRDWINAGAP